MNFARKCFLVSSIAILSLAPAPASARELPPELANALPAPVVSLANWAAGPRRGDALAPGDSKVRVAEAGATRWIEMVVSPEWLPAEGVRLEFARAAFDGRDAVLAHWTAPVGEFTIAQTAGVFVLALQPARGRLDRESIRSLLLRALREDGVRWTGQGEPVKISGLDEKIARHATDESEIEILPRSQALVARPRAPAGNARASETDLAREDAADNAGWFEGDGAASYWFRNLHWWTDGETLGVYFLKSEGGMWFPNYSGDIDRDWFAD